MITNLLTLDTRDIIIGEHVLYQAQFKGKIVQEHCYHCCIHFFLFLSLCRTQLRSNPTMQDEKTIKQHVAPETLWQYLLHRVQSTAGWGQILLSACHGCERTAFKRNDVSWFDWMRLMTLTHHSNSLCLIYSFSKLHLCCANTLLLLLAKSLLDIVHFVLFWHLLHAINSVFPHVGICPPSTSKVDGALYTRLKKAAYVLSLSGVLASVFDWLQ